jgi:hypothetical protein
MTRWATTRKPLDVFTPLRLLPHKAGDAEVLNLGKVDDIVLIGVRELAQEHFLVLLQELEVPNPVLVGRIPNSRLTRS